MALGGWMAGSGVAVVPRSSLASSNPFGATATANSQAEVVWPGPGAAPPWWDYLFTKRLQGSIFFDCCGRCGMCEDNMAAVMAQAHRMSS